MKTYPMFAIIVGRPCLVVGGGAVGERKVRDLREAGARVTVVSRELAPTLAELADRGEIQYLKGDFTPEHLKGMALVVGATDDPEVNSLVSRAAQAAGILVNIVDQPELCTFIVPARVSRGELTIAVSTGGASPALARRVREDLEEHFGPEYGPYLELLKAVRERLLSRRRGHPDNAELFHRLVKSPLKEAVARGDRQELVQILAEVLTPVLDEAEVADLASQVLKS